MKLREYFLNLVDPKSRGVAEDFINGKIDAMFIEYTPKDVLEKGSRSFIEIFENDQNKASKIIEFNDSEKEMEYGDIYMIYEIVRKYGDRYEYEMLKKLDKDEYKDEQRMVMHRYVKHPENFSTIIRKKCQKIYESLSDSDKLLLEISGDYGEDLECNMKGDDYYEIIARR